MIVTHEEGDSIPAGDLYVEGDDGNATWAALSGSNASEMVEPDDAAQVSGSNAFGSSVGSNDRISVVWRNATMNGTAVLSEWNAEGTV